MGNGADQASSRALLAEPMVYQKGRASSKIHLLVPTTAWIAGPISAGAKARMQEDEHTPEQLKCGAHGTFKTPPVSPSKAGCALACTQGEL